MSSLLRSRRSVWWSASAVVLLGALLYVLLGRTADPLDEVAEPSPAAAIPEGRVVKEISEGPAPLKRSSLGPAQVQDDSPALSELRVTGDTTVFPCALVLLDEGHAALAVLSIEREGVVLVDAGQLAETKGVRAAMNPGLVFAPELVREPGQAGASIDLGRVRKVNSKVSGLPDRTKGLDLDANGQPKDFGEMARAAREKRAMELFEEAQARLDGLLAKERIREDNHKELLERMREQLVEAGYLPSPEAPPEEVGAKWESGLLAGERPISCGTLDLVVGGVWRDDSYVERTCGVFQDERPVTGFVGSLPSAIERLAGWAGGVTLASSLVEDTGQGEPDHPETWPRAQLNLASPLDLQVWLEVADHPKLGKLEESCSVRIRPVTERAPNGMQFELPKYRVDHVLPGLWAIELFDERFGYGAEYYSIAEDGLRELVVSRGLQSTRVEFPKGQAEGDTHEHRAFTRMPGVDLPIPCGVEMEESDALILKEVPRGICHLAIRRGQTAFQGLQVTCDRDVLADFRLDPPRPLRLVPTGWVGLPTRARWLAILDELNTPIELIELSQLKPKTDLPQLEEGITRYELFDRNGTSMEWIRVEGDAAGPVAYVAGTWLQGEEASSVLEVL